MSAKGLKAVKVKNTDPFKPPQLDFVFSKEAGLKRDVVDQYFDTS